MYDECGTAQVEGRWSIGKRGKRKDKEEEEGGIKEEGGQRGGIEVTWLRRV